MKILLLSASLALVSLSSMAMQHKDKNSMSFEEAKKQKSEMLGQKKATLEEAQNCVDETTDKEGIQKCMENIHSGMSKKKI